MDFPNSQNLKLPKIEESMNLGACPMGRAKPRFQCFQGFSGPRHIHGASKYKFDEFPIERNFKFLQIQESFSRSKSALALPQRISDK